MVAKTKTDLARTYTVDEFMSLPDDGKHYELVEGSLEVMSPAGEEHGKIAGILHGLLFMHVYPQKLGNIYSAETGFLIAPNTVRGPDVAFVAAGRLPVRLKKAAPLAPDLIAEVLSPHDSWSMVERKVREYQQAGVRLIWVIDPHNEIVRVYNPHNQEYRELNVEAELDGGTVLPGFKIKVALLFQG